MVIPVASGREVSYECVNSKSYPLRVRVFRPRRRAASGRGIYSPHGQRRLYKKRRSWEGDGRSSDGGVIGAEREGREQDVTEERVKVVLGGEGCGDSPGTDLWEARGSGQATRPRATHNLGDYPAPSLPSYLPPPPPSRAPVLKPLFLWC